MREFYGNQRIEWFCCYFMLLVWLVIEKSYQLSTVFSQIDSFFNAKHNCFTYIVPRMLNIGVKMLKMHQ